MNKISSLLIVILLFWANILYAQHLKKDGTPDMRYKENKTNYSLPTQPSSTNNYSTPSLPPDNYSTTHLKKDGTPDMRYKENKTNYSLPTQPSSTNNYSTPSFPPDNYPTTHLKKDGTNNKRYKQNKTSTTSHVTTTTLTYPKYHKTSTSPPTYTKSNYSSTVTRDANDKIKRSGAAKLSFMKQTGYPHGRPGYVIDHVIPLKKGGCDCPANMQWQTIAEAKEKDKWE